MVGRWLIDRATRHADQDRLNLFITLTALIEAINSIEIPVPPREELAALAAAQHEITNQLANTLSARMDDMNREWFDLSTRVQNSTTKHLRVP